MRVLPIALVVACGGSAAPPPRNTKSAPTLADADALANGQGTARDYRAAARIYGDLCANGCGDLAACKHYLVFALEDRGMIAPGGEVLVVMGRLCDRGWKLACYEAALEQVRPPSRLEYAELQGQCDGGDADACEVKIAADAWNFEASSSVEARVRANRARACELGVVDDCISLVDDLEHACAGKRGSACIDWHVAQGSQTARAQYQRVEQACARGDAGACTHVPGREIADAALCDAGDYHVCERLANTGDRHAAQVACDGGMGARCVPPRESRHSLQEIADALSVARTQCANGDADACTVARHVVGPPCSR